MNQKKLGKVALVLGAGLLACAAVVALTGCAGTQIKKAPPRIVCNNEPEYWFRDRDGKPIIEVRLCFSSDGSVQYVSKKIKPSALLKVVKEVPRKLQGIKGPAQ